MTVVPAVGGFMGQAVGQTACACGSVPCRCGSTRDALDAPRAPAPEDPSLVQAGPVSPTRAQELTFITGLNPDRTVASGDNYWYFRGRTANRWPAGDGSTISGAAATITYGFDPASNFSAAERATFARACAMWSAVCNVVFNPASSPGAANILLRRGNDGQANTSPNTTNGAVGTRTMGGHSGQQVISIDTSVFGFDLSGSLDTAGGYGFNTVLHELGHALGLGHGGNYNASVTPSTDQFSAYDERQWTIMSYISWIDAGTARYRDSYPVGGTNWGLTGETNPSTGTPVRRQAPHTVMQLDIDAAQQIYGRPFFSPFGAGGQTFGFNTNVTGALRPLYDFTQNRQPVVTIYSQGVNNTLDLSGFSQGSTVNLAPGTFSSVAGLTNNLYIADGTTIDRVVSGSGNDSIAGTERDNLFRASAGQDVFFGQGGFDTAVFAGINRGLVTITRDLDGWAYVQGPSFRTELNRFERITFDDATVFVGGSRLLDDADGDGTSDVVLQNGGTVVAWAMSGGRYARGTALGTSAAGFTVVGTGDLDGDSAGDNRQRGRADLVLQNGDTIVDWILGPGGTYRTGNVLTTAAGGFRVRAVADITGEGTSDLILQNGNTVVDWIIGNGQYQSGRTLSANTGGFTVMGAGDFNGDGQSDLVLQNGGTVVAWFLDSGQYVSDRLLTSAAAGYTVVGTGDFNGDGTSDILLQNGGTVVDWIMGGGQYRSGNVVTTAAAGYGVVGTGDYNGDGTNDIALQSGATVVQWTIRNGLYAGGTVVGTAPGYTVV